jgi:Anti-sigma factor NepR
MSAGKKIPGERNQDDGESLAHEDMMQADGASSETSNMADSTIDTGSNNSSKQAQRPRPHDQDVLPGILGKQLRAAYGELLNAPLPDQFNELIKRLESKEAGSAPTGKPPGEENEQ